MRQDASNFTETTSQVHVYDKFGDARPEVKHPLFHWINKYLNSWSSCKVDSLIDF